MRAVAACIALSLGLAACTSIDKQTKTDEEELLAHRSPYSFHRSIAYTLLRIGQPEKAAQHIRRMMDSKPEDPEPPYLLARALLAMELYRDAERAIERSLGKDKEYAPAYALRGVLLDTRNKHKQAEKWHRKAVKLDPKAVSYYNNLGFCLYLQERYPEAVEVYEKALALSPASHRLHNNLGFALARSGKRGQALKHFKLAGTEAEALNNLGLALELSGDEEQAYNHYVKALVADTSLESVKVNLARVCRKLGRPVPRVLPMNKGRRTAAKPEGVKQ